jgi:hypothetical protein
MPFLAQLVVRRGERAGRRRHHAHRCRLRRPPEPARAGSLDWSRAVATPSGVTDRAASDAHPASQARRR